MEALKLQPNEFNFTNIKDLVKELGNRYSEEYTFTRYCDLRDWIISNEAHIKSKTMLQALKVDELIKIYPFILYHKKKKPELVELNYEGMLERFNLKPSEAKFVMLGSRYDPEAEKKKEREQLLNAINQVTLEQYEKKRDEELAKVKAFKKALNNPETLDEFKTFLAYKGVKSFSPEQSEAYDKLITDERRERRKRENKRHNIIGGVELGDAQLEIIKSFHTKHKIDIWMVRLDQWVRPSLFKRLCEKARDDFKGYYSSYRQEGAIPGFLFWNEENARLFTQLKEGDVDVSSIYEEIEFRRLENRVLSLREKAACLIEMGEEEYTRDRKTNTARRARMASSAEAAAARKMILGKTLAAIAEKQENETVEYLDRLSFISDLETLEMLISAAKWRMITEKKIEYSEQEKVSLSTEWANYIKFPYPSLYIKHCQETVLKAQYEDGKKMAAARFIKRFNAAIADKKESYLCMDEQAIEDYAKIFVTDDYYCQYYAQLRIYNRVMRMNLQSTPELRTAIRELIRIKQTISLTPEQHHQAKLRELERSFVCRNIEGFFPTPRPLALSVIEKAGIQPGDRILEPSAGLGHLADVITELHPDNELQTIEIHPELAEALRIKGYNVQQGDFMDDKPLEPQFEIIIMNPKFEKGADNDQVIHAYNYHLKEGGTLVAVMANNKELASNADFRQWLDEVGGEIEKNPDGSFASAFRPTGVSTVTVVIIK